MKDGHKYNLEYPKTVVLVRSGSFCQTYDDAALVISALTDYQVKQQKNNHARCGFNLNLVPRIKQLLVQNHISYVELQTSSSNEQTEILDTYDTEDGNAFDTLRDKGRQIVKAKQQAGIRVSAIKNDIALKESDASAGSVPAMHKESISKPSEEWTFIDALCQGVHPFTGQSIKKLDLNNPEIIRALFQVREKLK